MTCTWRPKVGDIINKRCPECGHIDLVHIGEPTCPVCDLRALTPAPTPDDAEGKG